MGGSTCRLSAKISLLCRLSVTEVSTVVGKFQLFFLSLVGNFFLVLSVISNIFSPFVASRLHPFTPSNKVYPDMILRAKRPFFSQQLQSIRLKIITKQLLAPPSSSP